MIKFFHKKSKEFYHRFICLKGDPRRISMGMAIGVFIGMTPTIPFHTLLVFTFVLPFKQNLTAALLGTWVMNPITLPFFYLLEYELGRILFGSERFTIIFDHITFGNLLKMGWKIFYPLQIGGLVLAPFFAVPAYFITYHAIMAVRGKGKHADCKGPAEEI